jgi:hypothetical protein
VIVAVWPASSVPDDPVEPEFAIDELPVMAGISVVPTMLVTELMPPDGVPATGRSRVLFPGLLVLLEDAVTTPKRLL